MSFDKETAEKVYLYVFDCGAPEDAALLSLHAKARGIALQSPVNILHGERGKPLVAGGCLHFSKSHTGGVTVFAVSASPVGVDIERYRDCCMPAIAKRFFHPEEAQYAMESEEAFFDVWTAKESLVKLSGEGIGDGFSRFSTVRSGGFDLSPMGAYLKHVPFRPRVSLAVACVKPFSVELFVKDARGDSQNFTKF